MDITVTWAIPSPSLPTDELYVYYKPWDGVGTNNWILAGGPLPAGTTSFTITGLLPNTVYRVLVSHECIGASGGFTDESTVVSVTCPTVSIWQGPDINNTNQATLFYSLYYPDSTHVTSAKVGITTLSGFPNGCPTPSFAPIGRTSYIVSGDLCSNAAQFLECNIQSLDFLYPSGLTSAMGYFGLDTYDWQNSCDGTAVDPLIFLKSQSYKFYVETIIDSTIIGINIDFVSNDQSCITFGSATQWNPINPILDYIKVSGTICADPNTCEVKISSHDGYNQHSPSSHTYAYFTEDAAATQSIPLTDNVGTPFTGPNVTYNVFCPVVMTPSLSSGQLGPGMGFELVIFNPAPSVVYTSPPLNFTGANWTQVVNTIANDINANASPYTATAVNIAGIDYIRLEPCTINQAYINIIGPQLLVGNIDIAQINPGTPARHGVSDAFIYTVPGVGDFIYGSRGLDANTREGSIQVTDIQNQVTVSQALHPIEIPINQITLVDEIPPTNVYQLNHLAPDTNKDPYYCLNTAIVDNPSLPFNHSFVYTCDDIQSQGLSVYNQSEGLVDTVDFNSYVSLQPWARIRYIEANQNTGDLIVLIEENSTQFEIYHVIHSGVGSWTITGRGAISVANEFVLGTITTQGSYAVASSTASSITFTTPGWVTNQWSNYRIYVASGPLAGSQAVLYNFPTVPNWSNDTTTLFIDPLATPTFNASGLGVGDVIYMLGPADSFFNIYDSAALWANDQYNNWEFVFEPNLTSPQLDGKRYYIAGTNAVSPPNNVPSLRIASNLTIGGYYNTASTNNSTISNLLPNVPYRLYRNRCGALFYCSFRDCFYFSKGDGEYIELDDIGNPINQLPFLDISSNPITDGAFQFTENESTGDVYAIMRSADMSTAADPSITLTSKDIYKIDPAGAPLPAIDGSALWGDTISGRISHEPVYNKLYFTSNISRRIFEYDISGNSFIFNTIPAVYKKSPGVETLEGAVYLRGSACKFVVMNRLANAVTPTTKTQYLHTNLFVYDFCTNTVESMLIGADFVPYSGVETGWNTKNLGEMFGEYNGYKDYCYGGMSVKTFNDKVYFKQYAEEKYYVCTPVTETGIAQIWAIGENPNTGGQISTYRLIRIFNIQSDGSLIPSKRTIYTYTLPRSQKRGPSYIQYNSFNSHVVGVTNGTAELILIDPSNLTGYYGGPNLTGSLLNLPLTSRMSIYTADPSLTNQIEDPVTFGLNSANGRVYIFGKQAGGQVYNYQVYSVSNQTSTSVTPVPALQGNTGTPNNAGLYNTGGGNNGHNYPTVYNSTANTIWQMGNEFRNIVPGNTETDRIIKIYNANNMTVLNTINLTALGAVPTGATVTNGATDLYHNHFYHPVFDMMVYYGKGNDTLVLIDPSTYSILYNGSILPILNLNRSPQLGAQNIGWMVPYLQGIFVDRNNATTVQEFWTYIYPSNAQYIGILHDHYSLNVDGQTVVVNDSVFNTNPNWYAFTFGQWKLQSSTTWDTCDINVYYPLIVPFGEVLELTMFDQFRPLVRVENVTQGWTYDVTIPGDVNKTTLPTFNTLNSINFFAVKADNINLFNGDILYLTFANPTYPTCPFIQQLEILI